MLQKLTNCYLIPVQCGREGHSSRERDDRVWFHESSLHYNAMPMTERYHGATIRPLSGCSSRLSRAPGLLHAGNSLVLTVKWLSGQGCSHDVPSTPLFTAIQNNESQ